MEPLDERFGRLKNPSRIGYLIGGFITRTLSIEERDELDAWVVADEANMQLFEDMTEEATVDRFLQWLATRDTEEKLALVKQRLQFRKKRPSLRWWHYAAAACVVMAFGFAIFYYWPFPKKTEHIAIEPPKPDIAPGFEVAELRLSNGQKIKLEGIKDTMIGEIHISEGQIIYAPEVQDTGMHEVIIPRKGSYRLVLPDGSKVWLNAESSIRYPGKFTGDIREVTVTGETYFDVAENVDQPFVVHWGDVQVEAVGTAFNINAFEHEITLTEGKVQVRKNGKTTNLKPGQQVLTENWKVGLVDIDPVIAWTRNQFRFRNARIEEVMRPVERWYNARVIYEDQILHHFNGTIDRNVPVSRVLNLLEETGQVHFTIEGDRIIVKK